jgi:3-phosphoshikimate 1-carboxyvinyltransferase
LVQHFGLKVNEISPRHFVVGKNSKPIVKKIAVEPDLSSCFALVACAALGGQMMIDNFPSKSWQPDVYFLKLLESMKIPFRHDLGQLVVGQTEEISPISCDLTNTPDLFPVLSVLLARASGLSVVTGIEHLVYKESNRLENVKQLLQLLGREYSYDEGVFKIYGRSETFNAVGDYDPDQDHRMAMAAQVANFGGAQLDIKSKSVVSKSFPEFWESVGETCTP